MSGDASVIRLPPPSGLSSILSLSTLRRARAPLCSGRSSAPREGAGRLPRNARDPGGEPETPRQRDRGRRGEAGGKGAETEEKRGGEGARPERATGSQRTAEEERERRPEEAQKRDPAGRSTSLPESNRGSDAGREGRARAPGPGQPPGGETPGNPRVSIACPPPPRGSSRS